MERKYILVLAVLTILIVPSNAQQALFGGQQIISPEINDNNSVTFRVMAPDAKELKI